MNDRIVGRNRKALFKYQIMSRIEAGLVLKGSEVKSLRGGHVGFEDSYAIIRNGEVFLRSLHIAGYDKARGGGHDPVAERKLLLKRHEIRKLEQKVLQKGVTLIPMTVYFKDGWAKVELALATGKRKYDKRRAIMEREQKRDLARVQKMKKRWTG
ncbi:MAG TPA: SsrA-binding protein SmpB [Bacteroidetes bacterium]|nr:SsrA-binding protein SmpB [Bacteroidota bacterium]